MIRNIYDCMTGEWREYQDYHEPLPENDPLWGWISFGLVVVSAGVMVVAFSYAIALGLPQ